MLQNRDCVTVVALVLRRIEVKFPRALMVQKATKIRTDIACVHGGKSFQNIVRKVTICI